MNTTEFDIVRTGRTVRVNCAGLQIEAAVLRRGSSPLVTVETEAGPVSSGIVGLFDEEARAKWCIELKAKGIEIPENPLLALVKALGAPQDADEWTSYRIEEGAFVRDRFTSDGLKTERTCNFAARIIAENIVDDGTGTSREFEIEATLADGAIVHFAIRAEELDRPDWVLRHLGVRAVVYPKRGDDLRVAILHASTEAIRRHVYAHSGWISVDGRRLFLHSGGAIGTEGPIADVQVQLPSALSAFCLPPPPVAPAHAMREVLRLFEVAPDHIVVPLLAAVFRAPIEQADFSLHVAGRTGSGKTALTAVFQQFFGAGLSADRLPGSWTSTANSLEAQAFVLKDQVFVVDDFVPNGSYQDVQKLQAKADRLLRAQGNGAGRSRLRANASLLGQMWPRGLIISTGEDVPRGHSLRARLVVVTIAPGDIDWSRLTPCQEAACEGRYASVLAGFVAWLAPRYDEAVKQLRDRVAEWRLEAAHESHRRTSQAIAHLRAGFALFIEYGIACGALSTDEAGRLTGRAESAFKEITAQQSDLHAAADPVSRFTSLVSSALSSGRAHVRDISARVQPASAAIWRGAVDERPSGRCIGSIAGSDLYLDPDETFAIVDELARATSEPLGLTQRTLWKGLQERGLLRSREASRETHTIRKTVLGVRQNVLHFDAHDFDLQRSAVVVPPESGRQFSPAEAAEMFGEDDTEAVTVQ